MNDLSKRSVIAPIQAIDLMTAAFDLQRKGSSVIHMAVGQPAAPTPRVVREAAERAVRDGKIGYTEALGIPSLRERIACYYAETHGLEIAPDRIVVTTGSSGAFNLAFLALFDVGDNVALPAPGYPAYRNILKTLGLGAIEIPTTEDTRWTITPDMLAEAHARHDLKGLILASPNNPNGTMIAPKDLAAIVEACKRLGIRLIMDEIYHGLVYGFPTETALSISDEVVVINSFSKYYCMTGWRIGWMVVPERFTRTLECLSQNLSLCVNAVAQIAGQAAFDATEELEQVKAGYAANRDLLLERLPSLGLGKLHPADGAFYLYADVAHVTSDSMQFARKLLQDTGVAVTPGIDFDSILGPQHIRLSYAGSQRDVSEGLDRIEGWLK
ncbi:MAG: pyridoxal phosphate-dependent aminotransferase [Phaeobacter gallaeciensis]